MTSGVSPMTSGVSPMTSGVSPMTWVIPTFSQPAERATSGQLPRSISEPKLAHRPEERWYSRHGTGVERGVPDSGILTRGEDARLGYAYRDAAVRVWNVP